MKRYLQAFIAAIIISALAPAASVYANNISVTLDGTQIQFGVPPQMIEGRTLVPLRAIFEALGADIVWDGQTQTVTAVRNYTTVVMQVGNPVITVNNASVTLDVAPRIIDGATLVPARAVGESFGVDVDWNGATQTVVLTTVQGTAAGRPSAQISTDLTDFANYWVELDGVRFAPGMRFSELLRPGFYLRDEGVLTNSIGSNGSAMVGVHNLDGDRIRISPAITATVRNTATDGILVRDGIVETLVIDASRGQGGEHFDNIVFTNGIRMGVTTRQEILNMFGEPGESTETRLTYHPFWEASFTPTVSNDLRTSGFDFTFDAASGTLVRVRMSFATFAR